MKNEIRVFTNKLLLLTIAIAATGAGLFYLLIPEYYLNIFPVTLCLFFAVTLIIHRVLVKANELPVAKFSSRFMITTLLKMLVLATFAIIYIIGNRGGAVPFVIVFVFLYITYTIVEVTSILKYLRKQKSNLTA